MADQFRVSLRAALSFTGYRGVQWRQGQIRILSDPAQVDYYRRHSEFCVEPVAGAAKAPAPTSAEPSEPPKTVANVTRAATGPATAAELSAMRKADLVEIGTEYGLTLDVSMKKYQIVAALLAAQAEE